jgi:hypothetical protein
MMKPGSRRLVHTLIALAAAGIIIAAHGAILYGVIAYYMSSHAPLWIAVAAGILIALKHLGLLAPLLDWFRRRRPPCVQ